jgi:hypothetical protein
MVHLRNIRPDQYRARAQEARAMAEMTEDEKQRKILLNDADLWERMADWEEKYGPSVWTLPR